VLCRAIVVLNPLVGGGFNLCIMGQALIHRRRRLECFVAYPGCPSISSWEGVTCITLVISFVAFLRFNPGVTIFKKRGILS